MNLIKTVYGGQITSQEQMDKLDELTNKAMKKLIDDGCNVVTINMLVHGNGTTTNTIIYQEPKIVGEKKQ